ncbi:phosphatase PAP2 family protein [Shewanella waksmanii]|uniref:phosphatase PAP2 family protein n=1 Tax=Shewanella waksmanii TaxID=213783 RepID=UPI0037370224
MTEQVLSPKNTTPFQPVTDISFKLLVAVLFALHLLLLNDATNASVFTFVNDLGQYLPAGLLAMLTDIGDGATLGFIALCYLVYRPDMVARVVVASMLSLLLVPALKGYYDAPRPAAVLDVLHIIGETRLSHSFPSGHAATAFLLAGLMVLATQKLKLQLVVIAIAASVALSRIMVGAHWPVDVIMGAFVGLFCGFVACRVVPLVKLNPKRTLQVFAFLYVVLVVCIAEKLIDQQLLWQVIGLRVGLIGFTALLMWRHWRRISR